MGLFTLQTSLRLTHLHLSYNNKICKWPSLSNRLTLNFKWHAVDLEQLNNFIANPLCLPLVDYPTSYHIPLTVTYDLHLLHNLLFSKLYTLYKTVY